MPEIHLYKLGKRNRGVPQGILVLEPPLFLSHVLYPQEERESYPCVFADDAKLIYMTETAYRRSKTGSSTGLIHD